jgi:pimeloyl-ACP methyl ester carboxylesterase
MIKKQSGFSTVLSIIVSSISLTFILTTCSACHPANYNSLEISYLNSHDGIRLSGILTIPKGDKLYPAVLLVQGTGSHNRDEEVLGHKPFEVIADYLTKRGIAVLRVDRRGCGKSEGTYVNLDMDHYVEDAVCGIQFLKSYTNIDTNRIGMIGHSLGGFIAAISSSCSSDISFIISCGGPGIWGKDIGYSLNKLWAECSGTKPEDYKEIKRLSYRWYELTTQESVTQKEADEFTQIYIRLSNYMSDDLRRMFYPGPADKAYSVLRSPEYCKAIQIDPLSVWENVRCPVLAINGSKDYQAVADENLEGIRNGLIAGKNTQYKIVKLKNHNHLFQRTENGSPAEYARIKESFSPIALNLMSKWILSLTGTKPMIDDFYNDPDAIAEEAPLPEEIAISKPDEQIHANIAALSSSWYGRWDSSLATQLVVEKIKDRAADVVYSWADHPMGYFQKGWMRKSAKTDTVGAIEFENGTAVWNFRYDKSKDVLIGNYKDQYVALKMIMRRKKE